MKSLIIKNGEIVDLSAIEISSARIKLVPVSSRFAEDIFREFDSDITQFMIPVPASNISETQAFISSSQEGMRKGKELVLAILDQSTDEFLGICACHGEDNPQSPELGLWVKKKAHGKKVGRESMTLMVNWLHENIEFSYLLYPVDRKNIASRKIPEYLGGLVMSERIVASMSGALRDEVVYHIRSCKSVGVTA